MLLYIIKKYFNDKTPGMLKNINDSLGINKGNYDNQNNMIDAQYNYKKNYQMKNTEFSSMDFNIKKMITNGGSMKKNNCKKFINKIFFCVFLTSCAVITPKNAKNHLANFPDMDARTYYGYLREEHKENSQKIISKNEFVRFREKGNSLEDFKNYRDFCIKTDYFFCHWDNINYFVYSNLKDNKLTKDCNGSDFTVEAEEYLSNKNYFDNLSKEDGKQCIIQYFNIKQYRKQLIEEVNKRIEKENNIKREEIVKNISKLEKFIENEYKNSFHEKIVVSLKDNFKIFEFIPQQWNFNNHYIKVTSDGDNINVIKDDKLIFSSPYYKYKFIDFNTTSDIYEKEATRINNLVEKYKKDNITKELENKCKKYYSLI